MKKLFAIIAMVAVCSFGATTSVMAQEESAATEQTDTAAVDTAAVDTAAVDTAAEADVAAAPVVEEENEGIFKVLKVCFKVIIFGKRNTINSCKYLIVAVASPICCR